MGFWKGLFRASEEPPAPAEPPAEASSPNETSIRLSRALVTIATEVWRARSRLAKLGPEERAALRVVQSSVEKMGQALESLGIRIDDPTGRSWDERDPVKVLVFEPADGLSRAQIAEVVKPTLYLGEMLLAPGEVVVVVPRGDERASGGVQG